MSDRIASPPTLGFLTIQQEPAGWAGYYLVTNAWGRPLEFRMSSAVQPNTLPPRQTGETSRPLRPSARNFMLESLVPGKRTAAVGPGAVKSDKELPPGSLVQAAWADGNRIS